MTTHFSLRERRHDRQKAAHTFKMEMERLWRDLLDSDLTRNTRSVQEMLTGVHRQSLRD
ncbi:MAG: hypothetical protein Q7R81_03295 [Candidatus Peregrinibacteria bacterium]|nr:hypothetical protein [Candidatus Peregrinibacteria bacterium]